MQSQTIGRLLPVTLSLPCMFLDRRVLESHVGANGMISRRIADQILLKTGAGLGDNWKCTFQRRGTWVGTLPGSENPILDAGWSK